MVELDLIPVSFRHRSVCFPLALCVPGNQIQNQKSDRQPSWFLVHVFPKVRPELTWGEPSAHKKEHDWNKKEKRKREKKRRKGRRENEEEDF